MEIYEGMSPVAMLELFNHLNKLDNRPLCRHIYRGRGTLHTMTIDKIVLTNISINGVRIVEPIIVEDDDSNIGHYKKGETINFTISSIEISYPTISYDIQFDKTSKKY